ncbi:transcription elongation factor GreA [Bacteriovorax stolpii]|uniref:Transcription elongation factor GreA n=1 Tax=Bacteriovorax stolpii TaxID=960 RepID=A0A2K9NPI3_BACTC|nr:transcription elongation factor GreA [Bacteriovorax stolpii]AUN96684.1 transcription elongation factor GreA [Bacteriovorax stolpii]QDK43385.1 transcription elongation factor GreA [Bacteriovorax stolpii]TDP53796.1 transcription elongation factor GreA [Bacteriovorax stolpii]
MDELPITLAGKNKLEAELNQLVKVEREELKVAIAEARELGDLKENAEYHAAKEKQGIIEGRIAQLQGILARSRVVEVSKIKSTKVVFGATVSLLDVEKNVNITYKIVGEDESDIRDNKISYNSPLGKALIGKEEGDTVIVKAPKGDIEYEIESFEFVD